MAIENLPVSIQNIIQQDYLQKEFHESLQSVLGYDTLADVEPFVTQIGQTETRTRAGLFAPVETPTDPSQNTNLDNGMTPQNFTTEQYTMQLNMWNGTADTNLVTQRVNIDSILLQNAKNLGIQSVQSLDRLARNSIFDAYLSGNTRVRTTLGAPAATIAVDDVRGFTTAIQNGVVSPVSGSNTMNVVVGSNVYTLIGFSIDATNVSTQFRGISGTLTFSSNVSVSDGTAGNAVVSAFAPTILRPNARATTNNLLTSDLLTLQICRDAVTRLRNNAVLPHEDGYYHIRLDNTAANQLWSDPEFQLLFRGTGFNSEEFRRLRVMEALDMKFILTTEAPQQTNGAVKVRRSLISGQSALIKGYFTGVEDDVMSVLTDGFSIRKTDEYITYYNADKKIQHVVRMPLDRLQQVVSQSWMFIGGYSVPTDVTANQVIIPTANNSYFKRCVVIETGSL